MKPSGPGMNSLPPSRMWKCWCSSGNEPGSMLLSRLPRLRLISQTGKISNHLDLEACTRAKVLVAEGIGSPIAPSELCWALVMAASRHIPAYVQHLIEGGWQQSGTLGLGRTLHGLTFGIWGYGKIGRRVAQYAKAFGMTVLVWGSESSRGAALFDGFEAAPDKAFFFREADVLSLHLRLNAATKGCVTREDLALMKPDSLFVNISRSGLVEENALFNELKRMPTKRAAVDVYDTEPIRDAAEPLLSLPNVLCSPHLGTATNSTSRSLLKMWSTTWRTGPPISPTVNCCHRAGMQSRRRCYRISFMAAVSCSSLGI